MQLSRYWLNASKVFPFLPLSLLHHTAATEVRLQSYQHPQVLLTGSVNMTRAPAIAFSHGGGPMPLLGDPFHEHIVYSLRNRVPKILRLNSPDRPRAICLVTAHRSESLPHISSGERHSLLYDYYNFPPETYKLKYEAPGSPQVAQEVAAAMSEEGLKPTFDDERGWDHGVFVPMLLVRPEADMPIVQISVLDSEDPAAHFSMGRALGKLREQNIAIVGSGFASFHNMRIFKSGELGAPAFTKRNDEWSEAVTGAVTEEKATKREERFKTWREWPHAYEMHPRGGAEHFLPLVVVAGAGGDGTAKFYSDEYKGTQMFSYYWE